MNSAATLFNILNQTTGRFVDFNPRATVAVSVRSGLVTAALQYQNVENHQA
jgi:hypothetical protein